MYCADLCTCQHGYGQGRYHGHVDSYSVAFTHAQFSKAVGQPVNLMVHVQVCKFGHIALFGFEYVGYLVLCGCTDVAVEGVVDDVVFGVGEPVVEGFFGIVQDFIVW